MAQPIDLTEFPNSSGWHILHNPNKMTYEIKSENGRILNGTYTQRSFAEKYLYDYLKKMSAPTKPVGRPKKNVNT